MNTSHLKLIALATAIGLSLAVPARADQAADEATVKNYLQTFLIDPMSAQVTFVRAARTGSFETGLFGKTYSGRIVCALVNSKNRFGGYTGAHLYSFVIDAKGGVLAMDGQYDRPGVSFVSDECAKKPD